MKPTLTMIVCFMAIAMLSMVLPAGAVTTVSVGSTTSSSCDTVSIIMNTDDAYGIGSSTMRLSYDPSKITPDMSSISGGALGSITPNDIGGTIVMIAADPMACPSEGDILFTNITFSTVTGATGCSYLDLTVSSMFNCDDARMTQISDIDGQFCISGAVEPVTTVSIGSTTSSTCNTVSITIDTEEISGIDTGTVILTYDDTKINLNSINDGELGTVTYSAISGSVVMNIDTTTCPTGTKKFADVEFCPVSGASGCSDLDIAVTSLTNCNGDSITPNTVNDGSFCIPILTGTTVSVGSSTSSICDTVPITINTDDVAGIGSATVVLTYDTSKLTLNSVSGGALGMDSWNDASGTVTMTAAHATACPSNNFVFADLEFCPIAGESGCSDLDIEVTSLYNCNDQLITPTVNDGQFCIQPGSTSVSIESITSSSCDTVSITINTDDTAGIGSATVVLTYDTSKLTLNSVSGGALGMDSWNDVSGTVTMTAAHATACPSGNFVFADLEFCPIAGESGCSDLDIEVTSLYNCNDQLITPTVNDGQFCIYVGTAIVSIESTTSISCDTVSITINTGDTAGIGSATVVLTYDTSKLTLSSVSGGALGMDSWNDVSGTVTMTAAHATACPSGNFVFADLEFCPIAGESGCSDLDIEVTSLYNCNDQLITPTVNDGQFCIYVGTAIVSIESTTSSSCDTLSITIDTTDNSGIGAATVVLTYDTSKLTLSSVSGGALGMDSWDDVSGTVTMTAAHATACPTGNGILFADLTFCPIAGESGCSDLDIEVTSLYNCNDQLIIPAVNDGQFCINAGTAIVSIESTTSISCDTVSITIDTTDNSGIGAATIVLTYDTSKLTLSGVSGGVLGMDSWDDVSGIITMTAADTTACPTGNGILFADLTFCPIAGESGCSDLDLEVTSLINCNELYFTQVTVNDGQFCFGRLEGDVSNTGLPILGQDAQLTAQHIVHLITLTGEDAQAADVNDDMGGVTSHITGHDLQLIKQFIVHKIDIFPGGVYIP